jgi:hypothetical protein
MIQDISGRLTKEFATCLQANLQTAGAASSGAAAPAATQGAGGTQEAAPAQAAAPPPQPVRAAKPVGGLRLALWAAWRSVVRFFKKLFGSSSKQDGGGA